MKKILKTMTLGGMAVAAAMSAAHAEDFPLPVPPQDQGIPYTRSARTMAREAIGKNIALYSGSRYAYAYGHRTRLDSRRPMRGAAVEHLGELYVPQEFAAVILADAGQVNADRAPDYLASRFVHTLTVPPVEIPPQVRRLYPDGGALYVSASDVAALAGKPVARHERGLMIIGEASPKFFTQKQRLDAVITLFDTPDTLADPDIATENIPLLKRQGKWMEWVKHTPEQLAMLDGPETDWPLVPRSEFNYEGFNSRMLGSKVPAPGVYPRLLFSPQYLPMLRERIKNDAVMAYSYAEMAALLKTTWFNPESDDGKAFERLASGEPISMSELSEGDRKRSIPMPFGLFVDQRMGIYSSHVPYIGHCLIAIQLYALIEDDAELGRKAAAATVTWCELLERGVDGLNELSDSEWGISYNHAQGGETGYRARHHADGMNLAFLLDFGGKWMTDEQIDDLRRLIAKVTYGMADSHSAGSIRWEENNHTTWHMTVFLAQMAIEGLEGSDPESFPRAVRTIQAFSEFGMDPDGVVFESNGKSGAGFRNILLSMVAAARRGENFFGHPHWRKLAVAQTQCTSPNGTVTATSGTYAGGHFDAQCLMFLKAFYPGDRSIDWLLSKQNRDLDVSESGRQAHVDRLLAGQRGRSRMPIFTAPLSPRGTLYDTAFEPVSRGELNLPLVFDAPVHGMFSAYSDSSEEAAWMNLMVRENAYLGAGHQHADSGIFHFSALGVNWVQESPLNTVYSGNHHNLVLIDGRSSPDGTAPSGRYLGSVNTPEFSFASADIKRAYDYKWIQQVMLWDEAGWASKTPLSDQNPEFEDHPNVIAAFKGTQHYKMRNWWPSYAFGNWIPTCRAPYNPVEYAKRGVALVRGNHSYGIVVDSVKKDDQVHHYEWTACPGRGVWKSDYESAVEELPANQTVLGFEGPQAWVHNYKYANHQEKPELLVGKDGDPQLLVCVLNAQTPPDGKPLLEVISREGPFNQRANRPYYYDNIVAHHQGDAADFRVLLIPFRRGEVLPKVQYDEKSQTATIVWQDQVDELVFSREGNETTVTLQR